MRTILPIETQRLIIRKIEMSDAPFFVELFNSKGWIEFIGDRNIKSVEDAEKILKEKYLPSYSENGFGFYIVLEKNSQKPIGTCGVYKRPNLEHPDLGFAFLDSETGKGYGFESSRAVLDYVILNFEVKEFYAFTLRTNPRSINLLDKLDFDENGTYQHEGSEEELLLFSVKYFNTELRKILPSPQTYWR
ncbi:MAG: GNAT family N-acetyltransferase [Patiriisocius sp.]|uniref:GNAT family N-acetyltransferase n=1 Tax=Patiriisocius sp. TaxID=2822396 RepID=UPI003EF93D44